MKREITTTSDGSSTIYLPDWDESYHSKHGAIQEAYHVFIKNGYLLFQQPKISILEIGFGTGLNAFITYLKSIENNQLVDYVGVEAYPVLGNEVDKLNYISELNANNQAAIFSKMHFCSWKEKHDLSSNFSFTKQPIFFQDISYIDTFDLIYFDAFGFRVQPELWSKEIFEIMFRALKKNGVLVTYACRTNIKQAMIESGFRVEKLPGAPGKREMLRATKN